MTWPIIGIGVAAVAAGSAFAGTQYASRASIGEVIPAHGAAVRTATPEIAFATTNVDKLSDVRVTINGKDRTDLVARDGDGRLVVRTDSLKDGKYHVDARVATRNLFARTVSQQWDFAVDTTAPKLKLTTPGSTGAVNKRKLPVTGRTEPGSTVTVRWPGGARTVTSRANGTFTAPATLREGPSKLTIVAKDRAGNVTRSARNVTVDTKPPKLTTAKLPAKMTETDTPLITGEIANQDPATATIGAVINGRTIKPTRSDTSAEGTSTPTVSVTGNTFTMSVGELPQGKNTVTVFVDDAAGNRAKTTSTVIVDSTEEFGGKNLVAGARGEDVKSLQTALKDRGFKKLRATGVYDPATVKAVRRYQELHKISPSGIFGKNTRTKFVGKIVVTLSKFRLQLYRDGKVVKTYKVAIGQPGHPTPTGDYTVIDKQVDPAWFPPDSPWAEGLGVVPPGPGNPLGTRWIGTSAPAVGIHGTYEPNSVGTAASHGCIRMKIPEVEELYEQVSLGMPVTFRP